MIELCRAVYDAIIDHAIEGQPQEVCGILGGTFDETESTVRTVHRATNAAARPDSEYTIEPAEQLTIIERIEADDESVAGFYHSHPAGPPRPSATDRSRATWPGISYVIVVLDGDHPYVGSWRWNDGAGRFEPEPIALS